MRERILDNNNRGSLSTLHQSTDQCSHLRVPKDGEEKAMAPHSSTFAWKIPWMEEPGRLQSTGSQKVWHNWATSLSLSLFTFTHWRRKWQPTPVFLPGESQGWQSLVGCVYGVAQSRTWLNRLSSSSSIKDGERLSRWLARGGLVFRLGQEERLF